MKRYILNVLIRLDQGFNTIFMFGDPDETVSSRAAKAQLKGKRWGCVLCNFLNKLDRNHCEKSIERDRDGTLTVRLGDGSVFNA
jgi:hypothetical protein